MKKEVIVIGGGIIGLCSAYFLQKEGHKVTLIDQSNMDSGASYVNAGYLSPSHIIPLSAPGVMKQGLKWMLNPSSPLYIKPRFNADFLKWAWAFNKSCNRDHVNKSIPFIKDITLWSQVLYDDIKKDENFKFHYEKKGFLMLCQTNKILEKQIGFAELAKSNGLDAAAVSLNDIKELEPNLAINTIGGTYYKCDSHSTPGEFMKEMLIYLKNNNVSFYSNEKVLDINIKNKLITSIKTNKRTFKADEIVLAAGSWSGLLSKKLNLNLLLQAGKGYRINSYKKTGITIPTVLVETKVAVTPMNEFTRFAGTMEIAGINHDINKVRVNAIANAVTKYYPEISLSEEEKTDVACGLRPVSADGLPYIGKSEKCSNLTIATGHAMLGWSMGTGTGKLVSEIISNKKTTLDISAFHPDRRF
ncbi:amino acid dehydrogenase [Pseudalgibacter alginicilyticus]|uniref:Amino acid dehydrogenase n=1 Tax=Pseudalgibacter alginicilyticus TaxID=1736674 RepID=A0A0N7HYH2_9FLAO|nr:FAD-dependent oxidoreductase [Pseudalgibacter alginicilyticus]ALJ05246.1 amino acid dehydrogenase [Pseudalgibacter alginicilyticus]